MQINAIDVPPKLFERLLIPAAVNDELSHPRIPVGVRDWIAKNEGGPTPCFETRRSAPTKSKSVWSRGRCDAPQHEVGHVGSTEGCEAFVSFDQSLAKTA